MSENFANTPQSITELKAQKSHQAADWTPRDALVKTLRQIDSGEINPEGLAIIWFDRNEKGETQTVLRQATKDEIMLGGMMLTALKLHDVS